ncbi:ANL_HP_G0129480.mRNA.1.CDS.1 [Saccharomyces cerevisiae]|nr:ANL_HP_G0129480.mRNA.1.CDS.1 [Saccharomyces cerevisiae]CAI6998703.1 ANL_HP_G0129480.mRNA.1.CDS.1 [Saccharomyces cerevisiae]
MARIVVLISGSGSNLQALIDAQKQGQLGEDAHIVSVISSSKKAYGLTRAADNIPQCFFITAYKG